MHPSTEAILRWFEHEHPPHDLAQISKDCHELAHRMAVQLQDSPHGAELTTGLRKLLEATDCFVRASLPCLRFATFRRGRRKQPIGAT